MTRRSAQPALGLGVSGWLTKGPATHELEKEKNGPELTPVAFAHEAEKQARPRQALSQDSWTAHLARPSLHGGEV